MPVVLVILSTLVFWAAYWFIRMGGLEHMREASARRKEEARQAAAREARRTAPLRAVEDPREAAMILMLLIARVDGDPTREQIAAIEKLARTTFGMDHELPAHMAQARFIASRAEGFAQAVVVFADLFRKSLTPEELRQLVGMVEEVAAVEGRSPAQADAVAVLVRRLDLASVACVTP